jgi:stearoyl-CoA desaturase (delta-9 desaturase)
VIAAVRAEHPRHGADPVPMRFAPGKSAWLAAMLGPAVLVGPAVATPAHLATAAALTVVTVTLGHTVGLHRGIIHRAYRMPTLLRRAFAVCFALTGLGGPHAWLVQHHLRDHYQGQPGAPATMTFDHSVWRDAWWTLACAARPADPAAVPIPPEDDHDPWLRAVDRAFLPLQAAQAAALAALGGWPLVVTALCGRNALVLVGHWWVGWLAHTRGARRYAIDGVAEQAFNLRLLGVLSFGEGFHNNHHAAPTSARIGRAPLELDLGWWVIRALERAGLAWDVQNPTDLDDLLRPGARRLPAD